MADQETPTSTRGHNSRFGAPVLLRHGGNHVRLTLRDGTVIYAETVGLRHEGTFLVRPWGCGLLEALVGDVRSVVAAFFDRATFLRIAKRQQRKY